MKERIVVSLVVIAAIVLAMVNFVNQFTGYATITPGASYGPIFPDPARKFNYVECKYVTENDGWDVTRKGTVQYRDITDTQLKENSDFCVPSSSSIIKIVQEYHCVDGYAKYRQVNCPGGMLCEDGICVK